MGLLFFLVTIAIAPTAVPAGPTLRDRVAERVRSRLEAAAVEPSALVVEDQPLYAAAALRRFYEQRLYRPAWLAPGGRLDPVRELLAAIREARRHGLEPLDYHLAALQILVWKMTIEPPGGAADPELLADLDIIATDAFLLYGTHLLAGRVDPSSLQPSWPPTIPEDDVVRILDQAIVKEQVGAGLDQLAPADPGYQRLQRGLARYRGIAAVGGWPAVPDGPTLEPGADDARVPLLRRRLLATGDLAGDTVSTLFDGTLGEAVRRFQARHGLDVDGVVGPRTLAALDVPAADRVSQIERDLERWRWLPRQLGRRHIQVNVPAFELRVVEDGATVATMRAVVGKPYRQTPVFSATMTYLVVSPYWHVPPGIAVRDILPAVQKDPSYLAEKGLLVFAGWGDEEHEIDPAAVDWESLTARSFPYHFRQEPGDKNLLGRIKFMFPNQYNVYLHDTPLPELFLAARRDFSSGCIRLERPFELADYVLRGDPRWTHEALAAAAIVDAETIVPLPERIPVYLVYRTSWVDDEVVEFRDDIYGRDAALKAAMAAPLAATAGATTATTRCWPG